MVAINNNIKTSIRNNHYRFIYLVAIWHSISIIYNQIPRCKLFGVHGTNIDFFFAEWE